MKMRVNVKWPVIYCQSATFLNWEFWIISGRQINHKRLYLKFRVVDKLVLRSTLNF